jgi:signal transduction histidine kinase/CheY-like chemotaxis protein/HPt (histidine-containing phosphotransfer) domain-containing protein
MQTLREKFLDRLPGMAYQFLFNAPGHPFTLVSEGCEVLTEYTTAEFLSGEIKFMDIVHANDIDALKKLHEETLGVGEPLEISFWISTKNGEKRRVLSNSRISKTDENGMPYIIEGFLTDVTKLFQTETSIADNREGSSFWARMGYGIRTPMNTILGLAELGLREDMPETVREYTQTIKRAGEDLMSVLNDITDYRKIERGELEIENEEYTFTTLLQSVMEYVNQHDPGIEFLVFADSKIPQKLIGDAERIGQVMRKLLSNAIKFSDKGFISLSVEWANNSLAIKVEDSGRGIKDEDKAQLFTAFSQFDYKSIEGVGLGLPIVKNLVRLMNGTIEVISAYGTGSIFVVTLPQGTADSTPICAVNKADDYNVLIVERKWTFAEPIIRSLENLGVKCLAAASVAEIRDALVNNTFTHVFASELFDEFKNSEPNFETDAEVIYTKTFKPIFSINAANILNGIKQKTKALRNFTAPEARVLVVDDIKANLTVAEGFLQTYRMKIDLVECAVDAIEALKARKYDLVLMDYLMPIMTGAEASVVIRNLTTPGGSDYVNVPIVALTANTENNSRNVFLRSGMSDFMPKPLDAIMLKAILKKWLPKEKLVECEGTLSSGSETSTALEISGIDVKKGISKMGGNFDLYLRVIKDYQANGEKLIGELKKCVEANDMKNYHIHAHALNSISENIGADELSRAAAALEDASEQGDFELVRKSNPGFLVLLTTLLENIKSSVSALKIKGNQKDEGVPMDKKKILMIDDSVSYLLILNDILKNDYEPFTSVSAQDGIETAKLTKPDLILLDLVMPEMDGYEVLGILKADADLKDIPVVIMSGKEQETNEEKGKNMGAAGYIKKPFDANAVMKKIRSILK